MPRAQAKRGAGKGGRRESAGTGEPRIEQHLFWGKNTLRAFPGVDGCPFWLPKNTSEKELFDAKAMLERLTPKDEELLYRVEVGLSETAAMIDLIPWMRSQWDNRVFDDFKKLFDNADEFLTAASYLNTGNDHSRDDAATKKHLKNFFKFLDDRSDGARVTRKLSMFYARGFLAVMGLHKMFAFNENRKAWARGIQRERSMKATFKDWKRAPQDSKKLVEALADCMRLHTNFAKKSGKKNVLSDSSSEGERRKAKRGRSESSGGSGSRSDSGSRAAKGKRKSKAKAAKALSSSGSASRARSDRKQKRNSRSASRARSDKKKKTAKAKAERASSNSSDGDRRRPKKRARRSESDSESGAAARRGKKDTAGKAHSVSSGSPARKTQPAKPKVELTDWSIDELHEFEDYAQKVAIEADLAQLEAAEMKKFIDSIPLDIRTHYDLPTKTEDYAVASANAEATTKRVREMVKDVKTAYLKQATALLARPSAKFHLDSELDDGGLARLLSKSETYLVNRDDVLAAAAAVDSAENDEDKAKAKEALVKLEKRVLQEQVADYGSAVSLWEKACAFAKAHYRLEPTKDQAKTFLGMLDPELREAAGIAPPQKYEMRIKPKEWRGDVQRMFNIAYRVYVAWGDF